jgi:hypothetical protein
MFSIGILLFAFKGLCSHALLEVDLDLGHDALLLLVQQGPAAIADGGRSCP